MNEGRSKINKPPYSLRAGNSKILRHNGSPYRVSSTTTEEMVSIVAEWPNLIKSHVTSACSEGISHRLGDRRWEERIVFCIDPEHRACCCLRKLARCSRKIFRMAV